MERMRRRRKQGSVLGSEREWRLGKFIACECDAHGRSVVGERDSLSCWLLTQNRCASVTLLLLTVDEHCTGRSAVR